MRTFLKILVGILLLIPVVYFLGPVPKFEKVDNIPSKEKFDIATLDELISKREASVEGIKPDNESQFIWVDSLNKTEYSLIYLHGFSASNGEGQPIIENFALKYGANTYMPRLFLHGLKDQDALKDLTPKGLLDSAKEAVAIGKTIGEKLIIMSTSTGSTLATYLAANDPDIHALIMTAPNFDLYDQNSKMLTKPWGPQLYRKMMGSDYREWNTSVEAQQYWTTKNRIESHIALRDLLNQTMTEETYKNVTQPTYIAYYYKNEEAKDDVISIDEIANFAKHTGVPKEVLEIRPFDNAKGHVIASKYMNANWRDVQESIFGFCDNVLGLPVRPRIEVKLEKPPVM